MSVADRVAAALGPGITDLAGPLLPGVIQGLTGELDATDALLQPTDGQPGTPLSDLATTPYPRWLGQIAGVTAPASYTDDQVRDLVAGASAAKRGTPGAITAAVKATLTGSHTVVLVERDGGDPYAARFITFAAETPDPAATLAAALTQKPAGLVLTQVVSPGVTWAEFDADVDMTWDQAEARPYSWEQLGAIVPGTY